MPRRYTNEERALAREILAKTNIKERGPMANAAEKAYIEGLFPNRTLSSVNSLFSQEKLKIEAEEAYEIKRNSEQIELFAPVSVSERILREKFEAEKALTLLKHSIIDDAIGLHYEELKFCLKSIQRAARFVWPEDYEARVRQLQEEEGF